MSIQPNRTAARNSVPAIKFVSVTEWTRGRNSRLDIDRLPTDSLRLTENVQLDQNGTITPRPGLKPYGVNTYQRGTSAISTVSNLVANPSFEVDTTGWSAFNSGTLSRVTSQQYSGTASLQVVSSGGANSGVQGALYTSLTASSSYTYSVYFKAPIGVFVGLQLDSYTTGLAYVATAFGQLVGNGAWQRLSVTAPLGSTETALRPYIYVNNNAQTFYLDAAMLQVGSTAISYFDGSTTTVDSKITQTSQVYAWTGTANASISTFTTYSYTPVPILGQVFEYVYMNSATTPATAESWMIWAENRSSSGTICIAKNGNAATTVSGKTYLTTANFHFEQIYGKVLIMNGVDNLSYMDIQSSTITPFAALTTPNSPTATANGISGSTYNLRYRASAANQGETAASAATVVGVTALRNAWNGTTQNVSLSGNVPTGAARINIYVGDTAGNEWYLDTISVTGQTTWSYTDTGSIYVNTNRTAPVGDSTAGPRTTRAANIKGQIFMVGDTDNPGRIWFGGYGQNALDFSSYNGGGWVEPNKGGKDLPVKVIAFRDGKGTPMAACLSKGTNGAGKRYLLQPASTTLGNTVISYMSVLEDNGADGTDSPDGVVFVDDALWYPSRTGFKTTSTKPQVQNILSTAPVSDAISPDINALSAAYMGSCVGVVYDRRIFWSVPYQSTSNNQIWALDLRQGGAWVYPWYIAASWLWQYADNSDGNTKLLAVVNNQFFQLDTATQTNDNGVTFSTNVGSGAIKFSDDGEIWGSVVDVTFVFLRPQGNINLSVDAYTEDGVVTYSDTMASSAKQSIAAWGRYGWGAAGWGDISAPAAPVAVTSANPRKIWTIPVDEEVNMLTWGLNTVDAGVSYQLAEIVVRYVPVGFKELDNS